MGNILVILVKNFHGDCCCHLPASIKLPASISIYIGRLNTIF